uniref:Tubulin/FtsZ GTPase domain-containing protein n=1 Tax=Magallana gigas TaxID=29159 RepID=A0A8W8N8H4_MAGGI
MRKFYDDCNPHQHSEMTQSIVVQVGQCGNQIGYRFWDLALREHAAVNKNGIYDESVGSFFRNVDSRYENASDIPFGQGQGKIKSLKARAVLVDMEEGVVSEMTKGPLREVFDFQQLITDVSGSGNNWAVGHKMYGTQYREKLSETIRRAAEFCDCLQCFFVLHSMGGGRQKVPKPYHPDTKYRVFYAKVRLLNLLLCTKRSAIVYSGLTA